MYDDVFLSLKIVLKLAKMYFAAFHLGLFFVFQYTCLQVLLSKMKKSTSTLTIKCNAFTNLKTIIATIMLTLAFN